MKYPVEVASMLWCFESVRSKSSILTSEVWRTELLTFTMFLTDLERWSGRKSTGFQALESARSGYLSGGCYVVAL